MSRSSSAMSAVDATHNCNPPSWGSAVFSPTELGKVTVKNNSTCTNDFSLVVFDVNPGDTDNQTPLAMFSLTLAPGATGILSVGLPEQCSHVYQRDVFFGILTKPGQTPSDWNGVKTIYATGALWKEPHCGDPPPTPTCQDRGAYNFGKPLPCIYGDDPPAPPVDVCPNLEGLQLTVPHGYHRVDGRCIKNDDDRDHDGDGIDHDGDGDDNQHDNQNHGDDSNHGH